MNLKHFTLVVACVATVGLSACGGMSQSQYESVPAGYVGKVLTPQGWQRGIIEAGQVNLGGTDSDKRSNNLVLLESGGFQVKESFAQDADDHQDHRISTAGVNGSGQMPVATDVYIRLRVPANETLRNRVFAEITAGPSQNNPRVSWITVQAVYDRFVHQEARSIIRRIVGSYADDRAISANRAEIELALTTALHDRLIQLNAPLELQSVTLSNVMADDTVQSSRNRNGASSSDAANIDAVGAAVARNPSYVALEQVRAMERSCTVAAQAGHPCTFIVGVGAGAAPYAARAIP